MACRSADRTTSRREKLHETSPPAVHRHALAATVRRLQPASDNHCNSPRDPITAPARAAPAAHAGSVCAVAHRPTATHRNCARTFRHAPVATRPASFGGSGSHSAKRRDARGGSTKTSRAAFAKPAQCDAIISRCSRRPLAAADPPARHTSIGWDDGSRS